MLEQEKKIVRNSPQRQDSLRDLALAAATIVDLANEAERLVLREQAASASQQNGKQLIKNSEQLGHDQQNGD